jgi:hypothetical protein
MNETTKNSNIVTYIFEENISDYGQIINFPFNLFKCKIYKINKRKIILNAIYKIKCSKFIIKLVSQLKKLTNFNNFCFEYTKKPSSEAVYMCPEIPAFCEPVLRLTGIRERNPQSRNKQQNRNYSVMTCAYHHKVKHNSNI